MAEFNEEQYDAFLTHARSLFTPFKPILLVELFKGRSEIVSRIVSELKSGGRHIILFGDRGVGKTSLANLISFFGHFATGDVVLHRCVQGSTFDTISADILRKLGITHVPISRTSIQENTADIDLRVLTLSIGHTTTEESSPVDRFIFTPNSIAQYLENESKLIILDEFDRIDDARTRVAVADLIKQLSDADCTSRILIVGVSESVESLIGDHPSISRTLAQVRLGRMRPDEIAEILIDGLAALNVRCGRSHIDRIVATVDGFPHFAHLLGLEICSVIADRLIEGIGEPIVSTDDYRNALIRAIEGAQESLRLSYQRATETVRKKSDGYVHVLEGMAIADKVDVQINELLANINALFGTSYKQQSISNWLGVLVNERKVLLRTRVGFYKFADPMMRAYVRMIMGEKQIVGEGQYQKVFPFMVSPDMND